MSYLNASNAAFIQGGSYGNVKNSIGPFVAKVDPEDAEAGLVPHATAEHGADPRMGLPRSHGDRERRKHLRGVRVPDLQG
jgi:hypothetical protein